MRGIEDVKSVFEALASAPSVVQKQEGKRKKTPGLEIAKPAVDDEKEQHQSERRNLDRQVVVVTEEFRVLPLFIVKERRKHRGANPENAVIDAEDRTDDDRPDQQREKERGRKRAILTCLDEKIAMYEKMGYQKLGLSASVWGGEVWYDMSYELG